ncbi:2133_t:CDS:2 [Rhizophagus irregularis]|nr:2133_t:CDS:2 [Rhizophagus irregularis]
MERGAEAYIEPLSGAPGAAPDAAPDAAPPGGAPGDPPDAAPPGGAPGGPPDAAPPGGGATPPAGPAGSNNQRQSNSFLPDSDNNYIDTLNSLRQNEILYKINHLSINQAQQEAIIKGN